MDCARCAHANPPAARFCAACGASLPPPCPSCGLPTLAGQRFCNGCGFALVESTAVVPALADGERRNAVVVFSDLAGYTALNEALDPEEVEAAVTHIKAAAVEVIERWGGTVNQFVGDEVMAVFGVPLARRDDARRAVSAALELHRAVDAMDVNLEARLGRVLRLHTGIDTGLVVARRSDSRGGDFTLTGDTVNTAARLRSLAQAGDVMVSDKVWHQVAPFFDADAAQAVEVKGKEQPVQVHRIRGDRVAADALAPAIVGRHEELREFDALAQACHGRGRGRVVIVRGDPGIGKSRLVAEFIRLADEQGLACHRAVVLDFGAATGRDAVRSLARSLLGLAAGSVSAADESASRAAVALQTTGPEHELSLYDLAGVSPPDELRPLFAAMSVAARYGGSLRALCALAANACASTPLLLLVDDIHWADAWTLERLVALAALAGTKPLLLVMTTRFAGDPTALAWRTALHGAPIVSVDLGPLRPDDAILMATSASTAPESVLQRCVARAEGNPLFLEQLLLNAGERTQADLPGSILALVHARLDRLAASDKAALQAAAVLGQRFSLDAMRHLADNPQCDCRVLTEQFLVRPDGTEFLFCHALIRDGAYASLLHSSLRRLHVRAADWFASRDAVLAAEHLDRGHDARAPLAYLAASDALAARFQFERALALAARGLDLASERPQRFALAMARTRLLIEIGRANEAIAAGQLALAASEGAAERAQTLIEMAAGLRLNDRIDDGLAALQEAQPLAEQAVLALDLSRLHHLRGNLLFPLGRPDECLQAHETALTYAVDAGSLEAQAAALGGLGDAQYLRGRMASANEQFLKCVELSRAHGFGRLEVANLPMVGWTALHLNDLRGAVRLAHQTIDLAVRAAQPRAELLARLLVCDADGIRRGNAAAVTAQTDRVLALCRSLGAKRFEAQLFNLSAVAALRNGQREAANAQAQTALAICREHGMGHIGPSVLGAVALIETDPARRAQALAEGEAELQRGSVSHNHITFREFAIEAALDSQDWPAVEDHCAKLEAYTVGQPLSFSSFLAARGRALARFGRGGRSPELLSALARLREQAAEAELNAALVAL